MAVLLLPELSEIERRRKRLVLTQLELSKMAAVSRPAVTKIEDAYRRLGGGKPAYVPNYEVAKAIFEALEREEASRGRGRMSETISAVANSPVATVVPSDSLAKAIKMMKSRDFSQLPVAEHGSSVGRISEGTILDTLLARGQEENPSEIKVEEVMGDPLPSVSKDTVVRTVLPLIKEHKAVLVVERGNFLSGIVTAFDLIA